MPAPSRTFVKASILCLCLGAVLGALLLINRWLPLSPAVATLKASHVALVVNGWLTQLILGIAWWLFPPLKIGIRPGETKPIRRGQAQRGSEPLFWLTFASLNTGVLLEAVSVPLYAGTRWPLFRGLQAVAGLLLLIAAITFVLNMWKRIRALGNRP